jgi:UbiD family decarboxylase
MAFKDLREFLEAAQSLGEVKAIEGADWNLEIGCITEIMAEKEGPLLLFDAIPGYPQGFRLVTNFLGTPRRFALALGLPLDIPKLEMLKLWKERSPGLKPVPPQEVPSAPVMENLVEGADVDLMRFPAPKWHELDGGRYIGTADLVVMRDPDSGWVNVGTYRGCIYDRDRMTLWIGDSKHGKIIARKYWARGEACPVAIVLGCEPATWLAGPSRLRAGTCEYDYVGAIRGAPVEVIRVGLAGLPVPASSEIVLEGEIPPLEEESAPEGPFGEWPGYYTHTGQETVVRVRSVMCRNDPILLGNPPLLPTTMRYGIPLFAARIWEHLESSGIADVQGVWCHCHTLMIVISLQQRYAGQAMQALTAAAGLSAGADMYRYFVAVDDDIDPSDFSQVLWALCTRVDPAESVQILRSWTSDLDPRLAPTKRSQGDHTAGRMLIDACKPFPWRDRFPPTNRFNQEMREQVWEKWRDQLLS